MITFGLGSNATNAILARFNLAIFDIEVIVEPVDGEDYPSAARPYAKGKKYKKITIIVRHKKMRWQRSYTVEEGRANYVIRISNFINTTMNRIRIAVNAVTNTFANIKVKAKWKN